MELLPELSCTGTSMQLNRKTTDMVSFLAAHGRQLDPALPDGNCLFRSLAKQLTGDPSKHVQLRETLTKFIAQNPQVFTTGWLRENCTLEEHLEKSAKPGQWGSHTEIKAAASVFQRPIYVATDSLVQGKCMWTVFFPFSKVQLTNTDSGKNFLLLPKLWYELAYISQCHYDGVVPICIDHPLQPPPLTGKTITEAITL